MVSGRSLTRWAGALLALLSAIAILVAPGDEALAARAKKKSRKPAQKTSAPQGKSSSKSSKSTKASTPAPSPTPSAVEPSAPESAGEPAPAEAPAPANVPAAASPESAAADPAAPAHTIAVIIEGANARELDKVFRKNLAAQVGIAPTELVAESVTPAEQRVFDRPKNKREVVKAARKVAKRAKIDGVIYANVGGSTSKGYSAAILLVYRNGKVGTDATVQVARSVRHGRRSVLKWQYTGAIAAVQPGLENFPATAVEQPEQQDGQSLGDAMAAFDAQRGDEPAVIDAGDVVATVPEETDGLFQRRTRAPILLKIGIEGGHRSFAYNQPISSNLRDYSVGFVPLIKLEGEAYPFGNTGLFILKNLGWYASYERAMGVESSFRTSDDNLRVSNSWSTWQVGVHSRFEVLDHLVIGPQLTYGFFAYRFEFDNVADERALEVPDVRYNFLRAGLEARAPLFMFDVAGGVGYQDVLSGGRVSNSYFPRSSTGGFDAYLTIGYPLTKSFAIDGTLRYNRYYYTMNPEAGDTYLAGGAVDQYFMAGLSLAYMFGAHDE